MAKPSTPVALGGAGGRGTRAGARRSTARRRGRYPGPLFGPSGPRSPFRRRARSELGFHWQRGGPGPLRALAAGRVSGSRGSRGTAEGRCGPLLAPAPRAPDGGRDLFGLKRAQGVHRPGARGPDPRATEPMARRFSSWTRCEHRCPPTAPGPVRVLGSAFSAAVLGVERPRVALLSVGEEQKKGRVDVVEAHEVLTGSGGSASSGISRAGTCSLAWRM